MRPGRIRPGMEERIDEWAERGWSFNEAGADPPRNAAASVHLPKLEARASMRPGRIRPGMRDIEGGSTLSLSGFNEAGADPPRNVPTEG